jgi:hypothetical protein
MRSGLNGSGSLFLRSSGLAVAVLVGLAIVGFLPGAVAQDVTGVGSVVDTPANEEVLWAYQNAFRRAAQVALPVVVKIDVVDVVRRQVQTVPSPFSFFFGPKTEPTEPQEQEFRRPGSARV